MVFEEKGKPEYPEENLFGAREKTNIKLNPNIILMASTSGFEPGPHWCKANVEKELKNCGCFVDISH